MARVDSGPTFADRLALVGLTPQQREANRATLLLAEIVHELCDLVREQNGLLESIRDATAYTATPAAAGQEEGGNGDVLPQSAPPPPDPGDTEPAVADPPTSKPATRRQTAKTTTGKKATAARRSTSGNK